MSILQTQIKKKIEDKNLSVRSLELKAGLGIGTVQKIISGERTRPGASTLSAISQVLGCSVNELLNGDNSDSFSSISSKKQSPWNPDIYHKSQTVVDEYLVKHALNLSAEKVLEIIWEVYKYSLTKSPPSIDPSFVDWLFTRD